FFSSYRPHRDLHSFPTRRSSDLGVEPPDQRQELRFARLLRQPVVEGAHAAAGDHFHLASDVTLARQIVADEHDGQSRRDTAVARSEEHTSELQSLAYLVCRLLLE